jgi:hypothetical protein
MVFRLTARRMFTSNVQISKKICTEIVLEAKRLISSYSSNELLWLQRADLSNSAPILPALNCNAFFTSKFANTSVWYFYIAPFLLHIYTRSYIFELLNSTRFNLIEVFDVFAVFDACAICDWNNASTVCLKITSAS